MVRLSVSASGIKKVVLSGPIRFIVDDLMYTFESVAVEPSSWGGGKALYR